MQIVMKLKKSSDITWHDLPKIESPFFAYSKVENAFYAREHYDVSGLNEWEHDRCGYTNYTEEAQRDMLKRDIECGSYYLVANPPFSPLFKWIKKDGKKAHWHVNALGNMILYSSAQMLTRSVRRPAMTSTGYNSSVATSLKEPDASKWSDNNPQPIATAKNEKKEKTRILKDGLWKEHDFLNDVAIGKEKKLYKKGNGSHSKGEEVKLIQRALKKMDINIGEAGVDGIYGNDGHYATTIFQENYEPTHKTHKYAWNEPDGVVGKNTLLAMDEALVAGWKYKEPDYKKAPWMPFALAELNKHEGLLEKDTLLNNSIKKYHETTNAKNYFSRHEPNYYEISWCASFVNWCFNQTKNYKNPNSGFCALAHDWAPENSLKVKNNKYADGWKEGEKSEAFYGAVVVLSYSHVAFLIGLNENATRYIYVGGNQGSNIDGQSKLTYGSVKVGNEYALMKPKSYIITADEKKLPKLKLNAKGGTYETTH